MTTTKTITRKAKKNTPVQKQIQNNTKKQE